MKIGIYGGTFNPPHLGHVSAAMEALEQLGLDKLIVVPDTLPPHKELPEKSPEGRHRLKMTKLAFSGCGKKVEVSDIEMQREGKSYTVHTIAQLKAKYPVDDFVLFMGTDMFLSLETWFQFETIMREVTLGVFTRADDETPEVKKAKEKYERLYGARISLVKNTPIDISSSEIRRELIKRGGGEYLDDKVYEYIIKNSLYNVRPAFDWLRVKGNTMLSFKRMPHVAGCEREAVRLARRWGVDENAAREAAILHDCTKRLGLEEQLILCRKYGIMTDIVESVEGKLLHAKTGAAIAKHEFGLSDEVHDAIFWHTTGKPDMTMLEKVIYLADYIEPTRDFEGLEELRALAYRDIDKALYLGLKMSIEDMNERGIVPHINSREAMDWLDGESSGNERE